MGEVRCWAIGIDEVRGCFAAGPELREHLVAMAMTPTEPLVAGRPQRGLLGKLGPLLRRAPEAPVLDLSTPTVADAQHLAQGRYVTESRLAPSWQLLQRWLNDLAWSTAAWELDDRELNALDFDLARAGVTSQHAVRHLWSRDARLSLRALPGTEVGYLRRDAALALAEDWSRALPQVAPESARTVTEIAAYVASLGPLADTASGAGRPAPDVFTLRVG